MTPVTGTAISRAPASGSPQTVSVTGPRDSLSPPLDASPTRASTMTTTSPRPTAPSARPAPRLAPRPRPKPRRKGLCSRGSGAGRGRQTGGGASGAGCSVLTSGPPGLGTARRDGTHTGQQQAVTAPCRAVHRDRAAPPEQRRLRGPRCRRSGDEGNRTPNPRLAKAVLCQLSYVPGVGGEPPGGSAGGGRADPLGAAGGLGPEVGLRPAGRAPADGGEGAGGGCREDQLPQHAGYLLEGSPPPREGAGTDPRDGVGRWRRNPGGPGRT